MDQRDQQLLDKQLRGLSSAPRADGVIMVFALLAVFLVGSLDGI